MLIDRTERNPVKAAAYHLERCLHLDGFEVTVGTHHDGLEDCLTVYVHKHRAKAFDAVPKKWKGYPVEAKWLGRG